MATNSNQRNQAMAEAAAAIVADNPDLKESLTALIQDMVQHQRYTMRHGSPMEKSALVKAILPQMLNAMNTVSQTEQEAEERAAYERMLAICRGEEAVDTPVLKVV